MGSTLRDFARIAGRSLIWRGWRSLLSYAALLIAALIAAAYLLPTHHSAKAAASGKSSPAASPSSAPAASSSAASSAAPAPSKVTVRDGQAQLDPAVVGAAQGFAAAWVRHKTAPAAWRAGMRPFETAELGALMLTADPANVPVDAVTAPPRFITSADGVIMLGVPTDAYTILLSVTRRGGQWLVGNVQLSVGQ